ncbi:hypothetical protein VTK73DRAFT_9958 [Phialemonium thermophilum]|uniref:Uncharacterized protein n=1 Tax=Phialemonium thermophilum TaxID=223376 RepID=A0ABR3XIC8_9PEZI
MLPCGVTGSGQQANGARERPSAHARTGGNTAALIRQKHKNGVNYMHHATASTGIWIDGEATHPQGPTTHPPLPSCTS